MDAQSSSVKEGVDSVFQFIRRTAEHDGDRCRWKTADYQNQLHYSLCLFNGVGGVPLFLADYAHLRKNQEALELAWAALEWCAGEEKSKPVRGLYFGQAGPAFSAWRMEAAWHTPRVAAMCERVTESILLENPGPVTDMVGGAASNGFYLLQAWKIAGEPKLIEGAIRCGEWLRAQMVRDALGTYCLVQPDGERFGNRAYTGFAHGISGVAHFLTLLHQATGESVWRQLATELFQTLLAHAQPAHGGWNWSPILGETSLTRCQHGHGAPGIGLPFLRAAEVFEEPQFLDAAIKAGEATYGYGDFRNNPTQSTGLAGGGDFLLELWRSTGDQLWLDRALNFGGKVLGYCDTLPEGDAWPTDEPGLYSADFAYGASGTGHFLLRLETEGAVPMPLA